MKFWNKGGFDWTFEKNYFFNYNLEKKSELYGSGVSLKSYNITVTTVLRY